MQVWVGKCSRWCFECGNAQLNFNLRNLIRTAGLRHLRRSCAEELTTPLSIVFLTCLLVLFFWLEYCVIVGVSLQGVVAEHAAEALCGFLRRCLKHCECVDTLFETSLYKSQVIRPFHTKQQLRCCII